MIPESLDAKIRELDEDHLSMGFFECLKNLTEVGNIDPNRASYLLKEIKANPNHIIHVALLENKVVGTATLFIEPKFIRNLGRVGHIEDVAVNGDYEQKGIGKKIIQSLLEVAEHKGCYKTILDCDDKVIGFYEKLGFVEKEKEMRFDH